jgi:cytochrome c oxidase cbb3-type subunit 3
MKKAVFITAFFCLMLLIPTFMTSCSKGDDKEDEVASVKNEEIDITEEIRPNETIQNEVEGDSDEDSAKGTPAKGKEIFAMNCTPCHGQDGTGGGPTAAALYPKPRNLTDESYVSTLSNEHLFKVISGGGLAVGKSVAMPAWSTSLSDEDIRDVVSYIRVDFCNCEFDGGN